MKLTLPLLMLLLVASCSTKPENKEVAKIELPKSTQEAVASSFRSDENKKRDVHRHPLETLNFFGLTPEMTVVEIAPGAGWYMEIIAPIVAQKGKYIMAVPTANPEKAYTVANEKLLKDWMSSHPKVAKSMNIVAFDLPKVELAPEGTVDMILTFRNVHNWRASKNEMHAFKAFYKALKPGGVLGVVEHRELPNRYDPTAKRGYVREKDVINMGLRSGFNLVAKSEINANPKDTRSHPEGVWTLPPSLKLGEKNKDKYIAIGESDRMTLKFVKPLK